MEFSDYERRLCKKIYGRIISQVKDSKFFGNVAYFNSVFGAALTDKSCLHDK